MQAVRPGYILFEMDGCPEARNDVECQIFWKFHVWEEVHQKDIDLFDLVVADTVKDRKGTARFSANMF